MLKTTYTELIDNAREFLKYCDNKLQINQQETKNSWIDRAIELVNGLNQTLEDNDAKEKYLSKYNQNAECLLSLVYLSELSFVYKKIVKSQVTSVNYLASRIRKIIKAPLLVSDEDFNKNTNEGRNYLFELLFFAELLDRNFKANLGQFNDNPDIEVVVNSHTYAVECKRIFSEKSFISNFQKVKNQLNKSLSNKKYNFGIPVIDVSRVFVVKKEIIKEKGDFKKRKIDRVLPAITENEANEKALNALEKFFDKFKVQLFKLYNPKIPALFLHLSTAIALENQKPFIVWGHYSTVYELSNLSQISLFHIIRKDFVKLLDYKFFCVDLCEILLPEVNYY